MVRQHRQGVAFSTWQADLWSCLKSDCGACTVLNNKVYVCTAHCSGGEHSSQPPTIVGYVNALAFKPHACSFSIPQRNSVHSSDVQLRRLTARLERTWRQMINLSFASCNKWQAFGKFWRADERNNTRSGGGEIRRSFGALSSLISLSFCSSFTFDFYGRSKGRDITASVPLSFFFVDPLGAIVALKFKCRKMFSVECKERL